MRHLLVSFCVILTPSGARSQAPANINSEHRNGVVVAVSAPAAEVGLRVLKQSGTALDAAVAVQFALAVTHPAAGNIGGGGFMVVHPPESNPTVFEYRETAPAAAHKTMFQPGE